MKWTIGIRGSFLSFSSLALLQMFLYTNDGLCKETCQDSIFLVYKAPGLCKVKHCLITIPVILP